MNNAPEFMPNRDKDGNPLEYQTGESVVFTDSKGEKHTAVVKSFLASGRYSIKIGEYQLAAEPGQLERSSESEALSEPVKSDQAVPADTSRGSNSIEPPPVIMPPPVPPPVIHSGSNQANRGGNAIDSVQTGLDAAGVVEPTPFADGANAVISLARAAMEPNRRGEHLKNAGISALGMIPYVGDLAKGLKYGSKAKRAAKASGAQPAANTVSSSTSNTVATILGADGSSPGSESPTGGSGIPPGGPPSENTPGADGEDPDGLQRNIRPLTDRVVELTGGVGKAALASVAAANSISLMNKAALEYNRNLSNFNGELAGSYGKLEADRFQRNFKEADELSGSLSNLIEKQSDLEAALQEFQSPFKQMAMDVQAILTQMATFGVQMLDMLEPFSDKYPSLANAIEEWIFGDQDKEKLPNAGWMEKQIKRAEEIGRNGRKV